jgi:hypothetical protein
VAVTDRDMWICHAFLGMIGSHNNIDMLQCSNVFAELVEGHALMLLGKLCDQWQ